MDLFLAIKPTILIVDDTPANLTLLAGLLQPTYAVKIATRGANAIKLVMEQPPALILLDIEMPDMSGYEVCRDLKANPHTHAIPVIFLTSKLDPASEEQGLAAGAVDYITRPISPPILLSRVRAHLADAASAASLRIANQYLEVAVAARTNELTNLQEMTVLALASLAETRDTETGNHLRRTQHYLRALGEHLKIHPGFGEALEGDMVNILFKCAPLHDIGKVGIPDHILLKPGRLTTDEMTIMQTHAKLGSDAIEHAERDIEIPLAFLSTAKEIAHWHHEKWDGSGYPDGLTESAIPVSARLMAVADVFDTLTSVRVYKPALSYAEAGDIIVAGRSTHFDPDVSDAFISGLADFVAIAQHHLDADGTSTARDLTKVPS